MKPALAALALISGCQPALAATYGPPAPVEVTATERPHWRLPDNYQIMPDETLEQAEARMRSETRSAWNRFWIGQGLVATDLALTCAILAKGGREINPLFGRGASCGKIIGIRAGVSLLQYVLIRHAIRKDPGEAKRTLRWGFVIQGVPVLFNTYQLVR